MHVRTKVTSERIITLLFSLHCLLLIFNRTTYFNLVGSYHIYILMLLFFVISLRKFTGTQLMILGVILYSLLAYALKGGKLLGVLLFWLVVFFAVGFKIEQKNYLLIKKAYCISASIISATLLIQHRAPYAGYAGFGAAERYGVFFSELEFYDVNFTATFLTIPTVLIFIDFYDKVTKYRKLALVAVLLNLLAIYFTGSRAGLVVVFGSLFACAFASKKRKIDFKILYIVVGVIVLVFAYQLLPKNTIERLLEQGVVDGKTSRRYLDWKYGIEAFKNSPLWGNGLYSTIEMVEKISGVVYTAHNTYIMYLVMYGVIGCIPIFAFITIPIYRAIKKCDLYFLILYMGFLAQTFVIEAGFSEIYLIPTIFFWVYINCSPNGFCKGQAL